jgi:hypothetical protein
MSAPEQSIPAWWSDGVSIPERTIPARWSKEDPDAPSALELVEQLTQALWGWSGPLPSNVVRHWAELLEDIEDGTYRNCHGDCDGAS